MKCLSVLMAAIPLALLNLAQADPSTFTACKQADECQADGCHFYYNLDVDTYYGSVNDNSGNEGTSTVCSNDGVFCVKHDNDNTNLQMEYGSVWRDYSASTVSTYRNGYYLCQTYYSQI